MKQIHRLLCLALSTSLVLTACTQTHQKTEESQAVQGNPFEESSSETVMYAYGFGLESPDADSNMVYDGSEIEFEYFIDNTGASMSVGMLMFVNGIPQPYSVEGEEGQTYMHIQESPSKQKITVKASFTPITGNKGDTLGVRFLSILNPQIRPEKLEYIYGHTNAMMTFFPRYIEMEEDSGYSAVEYPRFSAPRQMTEKELEQAIYVDARGNEVNKLRQFNFFAQRVSNEDLPYLDVIEQSLTVDVQGFGGPAGEYVLIPYINQVPVLNEDFPCVLTVEDEKDISSREVTIDLSELDAETYQIETFNTFYMIAVPVDGNFQFDPAISKSYVFEGE